MFPDFVWSDFRSPLYTASKYNWPSNYNIVLYVHYVADDVMSHNELTTIAIDHLAIPLTDI